MQQPQGMVCGGFGVTLGERGDISCGADVGII